MRAAIAKFFYDMYVVLILTLFSGAISVAGIWSLVHPIPNAPALKAIVAVVVLSAITTTMVYCMIMELYERIRDHRKPKEKSNVRDS